MFEYDVNGYHVIVNKAYAVIDGKEIEFTPSSFLEITVTEEEIRGGIGIYEPKIKHIENADKYGDYKRK